MANQQYVIDNSDRADSNAFNVPGDEDGGEGDASFAVGEDDRGQSFDQYVHIDNGWDVNVDVTLRGSHFKDSAMDNAADDGTAITISNSSTDFIDSTSSHTYLELNVDPAGTPTSGQLTITFQSRSA